MFRIECTCLLLFFRPRLFLGASIAHDNSLKYRTDPLPKSKSFPTGAFAVHQRTGDVFEDGTTIEVLRFVTPYGRSWESLVDVTPYSPALSTALTSSGDISFYSFIDTWVDNSSGQDYVYVSNTSGACHKERHSDGNGWVLDAELIFWPKHKTDLGSKDTQPRSSITLAAGPTGGIIDVGTTSIHEGFLTPQGTVSLKNAADFRHVDRAAVYECSSSEEIREAAVLGRTQTEMIAAVLAKKQKWVDFISKRFYTYFALQLLQPIQVGAIDYERKIVNGSFDADFAHIERGTPVFISPWHAFTDEFYGSSIWLNNSFPLKPVGKVLEVSHCSVSREVNSCQANITMHLFGLDTSCLPKEELLSFPGFFVPRQPGALASAEKLSENMRITAEEAAKRQSSDLGKMDYDTILLKRSQSNFESLPTLGEIDLIALFSDVASNDTLSLSQQKAQSFRLRGRPQSMAVIDSSTPHGARSYQQHVCVLAQRRQGRFFERRFQMPAFSADVDSVILQLVITGHGWEATTEQCGEYCHAVYQLSINAQDAANITQWREDCKTNPLGEQAGTWKFARNGWCPGSAQPGLFLDITKFLKEGSNAIAMDLVVRSRTTGAYGRYVDHSGFSQNEIATLIVGATIFVYGEGAVQEIRAQPKAFTPAELAVRQGCSDPNALHPSMGPVVNAMSAVDSTPMTVGDMRYSMSSYFDRLSVHHVWNHTMPYLSESALTSTKQMHEELHGSSTQSIGDMDLQARAPWHLLHEDDVKRFRDGHRVRIFSDLLVQGRNRWNIATISKANIPKGWARVSLRLRLSSPRNGLKIDAWDRAGSFGIRMSEQVGQPLETSTESTELRPSRKFQILRVVT